MTERHLRCGADGCHFCCCCTSKSDRLGCLRRHVLWHLQNWFTLPLPPRKTILLLDELEAWEDNEIEKNNKIKNEFEKKNENKNSKNYRSDANQKPSFLQSVQLLHTNTPTHQHTNTLTHQHTNTPTHQHTNTPTH